MAGLKRTNRFLGVLGCLAFLCVGCSESDPLPPIPALEPDDAPSFETMQELHAAILESGVAGCTAGEDIMTTATVQDLLAAQICRRGTEQIDLAPVALYVYASPQARHNALWLGDVDACERLGATTPTIDAAVGGNWRVVSTDAQLIVDLVTTAFEGSARLEEISCLARD